MLFTLDGETSELPLIGIITEMINDDYVAVDTIIGGTYKVKLEDLELSPSLPGILRTDTLSEKELLDFRKVWKDQIKDVVPNSFRTPIFGEEKKK